MIYNISPTLSSVPQHPEPLFAPPSTSQGRMLLFLSNKPMENSCNSWLSSSIISRKSPAFLNWKRLEIWRQFAWASSPKVGCISLTFEVLHPFWVVEVVFQWRISECIQRG
ncbi:hypothetical protein M413DRAFT_345864 [Hebeloma cylindrosporum]|uniref:Uncharacterized protein n=1 Tax=Hebeloma cylindrosporum TaxID=76867 RepID=A0A0C3CNP6_HEBCY|nr:hypothetical protein M413DRAFT_345864 [Hebeloma cylindrosporum h7]